MMVTHWIVDIMSVISFDANTGIWWQCDDDNITQISDLPKGGYIRDIHKKQKK